MNFGQWIKVDSIAWWIRERLSLSFNIQPEQLCFNIFL